MTIAQPQAQSENTHIYWIDLVRVAAVFQQVRLERRWMAWSVFGIFLIHIFVIELLRNGNMGFRLYSWMAPSIYMIPVTAVAVFVLSFVIVYVWRKIPVLKMLVP